jgi:hypothetical protein
MGNSSPALLERPALAEACACPEPNPPPGRRAAETVRRLLIWVALYSIPTVIMLRPVTDPDVWWHLRTGQWVAEHGTVPATDPFSSYGRGRPWQAYSWLFELGLYGLYQGLGLTGIVLFRVVFSFILLLALHHTVVRREPRFVAATALTAAAFLALGPVLSERPWLFSILLCLWTLETMRSFREGRQTWTAWLLPAGYALWANLHIQFVYGLFLLGLACVAPLLDGFLPAGRRGQTAATAGSAGWRRLVILAAACCVATLANPYHVRVYAVVLEYGTQSAAYQLIDELQALDFRGLPSWAVLGLAGSAAFALGRRPRLSSFDVLLLAATAYFSFHSRRDLWFVVLAAVFILGSGGRPRTAGERVKAWRFLLAGAGVALVLALVGWERNLLEDRLEKEVAANFPVRAAAFLEQSGYPGRVYNDINWGGYLIWRLPNLPVVFDGRMNLHGDERIQRHAETRGGMPGWDADPELAAAAVVILPAKVPLTSLLRCDRRFRLVHADGVAVVFVSRTSQRD